MILRHGIWWDRFWGMIPKVLPTVYDDSLSYYEVLNKLIKATGELAAAIDGINPDAIRDYAETAENAADTASSAAESASASAEEASAYGDTVSIPSNTMSVNPALVAFIPQLTKVYTVGKLCVGTIGLKLLAEYEFDPGDVLVFNVPKPINVTTEGCKIQGIQVNSAGGTNSQTFYASIVNAPSEPRGSNLTFNAAEGYYGENAQILFTFCYVIE